MFKVVSGGIFAMIFTVILNIVSVVGIFYGLMWVLDMFGILNIIKEAVTKWVM